MDTLNAILSSEAVMTAIATVFAALLTLFINRAAGAIEAASGIQIEKGHREAFHEAIQTSVESALRYGPDMALANLRAHVVHHLKESVPDALTALTPGDGVLDRLIERYSAEFLGRLRKEPK
ncbi:hypothetical protein AAD018_017330 [Aestuariibius insulae]|uniref:hypothetical protein n=1 Tax=Aestuariibius insulae TaxID=2058287 RepID=UPI00345E71A9